MEQAQEKGLYARAHAEVMDKLQYCKGKTFTADDMCRWCGCQNTPEHKEYRNSIIKVLYNIIYINKIPLLKQRGNLYSLIEKDLDVIQWWQNPQDIPEFELLYPFGEEDNSSFGFEESIKIIPGDLLVLAGETNRGKTSFLLNLLVNNCEKYPITYFSSEFNEYKFRERIQRFPHDKIFDGDKPRFELISRTRNFDDAIAERPDNLCIIDWIKLEDDLFKMGAVLGHIKDNLKNGIAVVALQKRTYKDVGEGGEGTLDFTDAYFVMSFERLHVIRVKTPKNITIEGKTFGFKLVEAGTRFHNIREIKKCSHCYGKGTTARGKCEECLGTGYTDL